MSPYHYPKKQLTLFYAAGPGDIVQTFSYWNEGVDDSNQVGVTYSSMFFDVCRSLGARGIAVSSCPRAAQVSSGEFMVENFPKPTAQRGLGYYIQQSYYIRAIVKKATEAGADLLVMADSTGVFFPLLWMPLRTMRLIPSIHCTLWPRSRRNSAISRSVAWLNGRMFGRRARGILCHPNDIHQQVLTVTGGHPAPVALFLPLYRRKLFENIPSPPASQIFHVFYAGRLETEKGIDDLVEIAVRVRSEGRLKIELHLCGSGSQEARLRHAVEEKGIGDILHLYGHCQQSMMAEHIGRCHAFIVPTRTSFEEGFNQVVAEAILSGRPVITSSVCPALDTVRDAVVEVPPDDASAYFEAVCNLASDHDLYESKRKNCRIIQEQFYDYENSWGAALARVIKGMELG